MEYEVDGYRPTEPKTHYRNERSSIWWVSVIVVGVFLGNLLSFATYELYTWWALQQMLIPIEKDASDQFRKSQSHAAKIIEKSRTDAAKAAQRNEELRIEREKQNALYSQLMKTCRFWQQQVEKENTLQNRTYQDAACSRASGVLQ